MENIYREGTPEYKRQKNFDMGLMIVGIALALITAFAIIGTVSTTSSFHYEYIDTLGNKGTAPYCGQNKGNLVCKNEGHVISVVEYNRIEDK